MKLKNGFSQTTPKQNISNVAQGISNQLNDLKSQVIPARVLDIVLDENHPKFDEVGQLNGIGTIYYGISNYTGVQEYTHVAKPYNPQSKTFPLINELVLLFNLPDQNIGQNSSNTSYYYLNPISIWNHPHHNAYPDPSILIVSPSQTQDYKQVEGGSVRRVPDESTEINLNSPLNPSQNTFIEKTNIHPLMPFMGDILHEGRFGQSLRFGSTSKSLSKYANNWSSIGNNGDPITILKNGQPINSTDEGWVPVTENINDDLSSIYLTSYQQTPINLSREEFNTKWKTPPTTPTTYINPQIILNSDRIIINSKKDSIFLSAQQSIGLSCYDEINVTGKNIILDGAKIYLGSKTATQPVLKGDDTVLLLKQIVTEVRNIAKSLESSQIYPDGIPLPDIAVQSTSQIAVGNLNKILARLEDNVTGIKSNFVKVK